MVQLKEIESSDFDGRWHLWSVIETDGRDALYTYDRDTGEVWQHLVEVDLKNQKVIRDSTLLGTIDIGFEHMEAFTQQEIRFLVFYNEETEQASWFEILT